MGSAPVFHDSEGDITIAESGAIMDYILARYGVGRLVPGIKEDAKTTARYCDWMHRSNASVMPALSAEFYLSSSGVAEDSSIRQRLRKRFGSQLAYAEKILGEGQWLTGSEFTAADIMARFVFTNMCFFAPYSLKDNPNILRWTGDCANRPAFQEAFKKGDPEIIGMMPLGPEPPTEEQKPWKH